jgi:phosphoribosylamine--glycine ligase
VPILPPDLTQQAVERILRPAIEAIRALGIPYRGTLYAGVMVTPEGPKCIEFNCRFGDPETQAVLPLLESDLLDLLLGAVECTLDQVEVRWKPGAAVNVVAASAGYPGSYETGKPIYGIEEAEAEGCLVFHAGTRREGGQIVTDGGRVLGVTGLGADVREAMAQAYRGIARISFEGMHYRRDIGARNLR